ncbi:MAG: hypothetical protein PHQ58_04855 [Rhodoferax sp.]|uniref:hypothetical protein n=1 Tax=Rhodoferax sp. TaxID=50421 RepID=UPI002639A63D|nr:hypothetical protein [Rhodoferax sp.]MDD2879743.1 hypothetical protein [Rhodoferax sp.]
MNTQQEIMTQDYEDIRNWMALQSNEVKDNCVIVDSESMQQDYMLHIDKEMPKVFIPMMPRSAALTENNTVARITVAPTLIGCFIGYSRAEDDFMEGSHKNVIKAINFKGGYDICILPFRHAIQPSPKMVYDSKRSGEHWLVNYNEQTREYVPEKIGKLFVSKVSYLARTGNMPKPEFEIYIEVDKAEGILLSPSIHLKKGYHIATISFERKKNVGSSNEEDNFSVVEIDKESYDKVKRLSASLLSHAENKPQYLKW